jgi:hypothetical protein
MPRKSASSLKVISIEPRSNRLRPPPNLPPAERDLFASLVAAHGGKTFNVVLHRLIGKAFQGLTDDLEINRRLHCVATRAENLRGARGQRHSSRFKGVSWCAKRGLWYACIRLDGRTKGLGLFADEETAARAYNAAALAAWGRFAFLNDL